MTRLPRHDGPGSLHHVMNRGVAKRTLFEYREDARYFLSRLAWQVHAGLIAVIAYALLTTHYHLLVRSITGELSRAMQAVDLSFSRWFNRRRKRDGPLFRGRFTSRRICIPSDWPTVLRYIDANPVSAGLADQARDHPWCSARDYSRRRGPPWLDREAVEETVMGVRGTSFYCPEDYERVFSPRLAPGQQWLVERSLQVAPPEESPVGDLLSMAEPEVRSWMVNKAALADGTRPGAPLASPITIQERIEELSSCEPGWRIKLRRKGAQGWDVLAAGLLRIASGLTQEEVARRLETSRSRARRLIVDFDDLVRADRVLRERATRVLRDALNEDRRPAAGVTERMWTK